MPARDALPPLSLRDPFLPLHRRQAALNALRTCCIIFRRHAWCHAVVDCPSHLGRTVHAHLRVFVPPISAYYSSSEGMANSAPNSRSRDGEDLRVVETCRSTWLGFFVRSRLRQDEGPTWRRHRRVGCFAACLFWLEGRLLPFEASGALKLGVPCIQPYVQAGARCRVLWPGRHPTSSRCREVAPIVYTQLRHKHGARRVPSHDLSAGGWRKTRRIQLDNSPPDL